MSYKTVNAWGGFKMSNRTGKWERPVCIVRFSSVDPNAKVMSVAIGWYERPRQENEELCNTYVDILYVRST